MSSLATSLRVAGRTVACVGALAFGAAAASAGLEVRAAHTLPFVATEAAPSLASVAAPEVVEHLEMGRVVMPVSPPSEPDPTGEAYKRGRIIMGGTKHRLVLFTFDDGPDQRTTPRLLDLLDREGIKALFFVTTNRFQDGTPWSRRNAELVREIARRGHLVGSHTVNHQMLPSLDDESVAHEIDAASRTIEETLGHRPFLFRPPGGSRSPRIDYMLASRGYTTVLWNVGAGDFQVQTSQQVYQTFLRVFERREREDGHRGGIILLHDTYAHTVDAFPRMVEYFRQRNCELLDREEELFDFVDDLSFFFAPRGDAAPSAEAPLAIVSDDILAFRQERLRETTQQRCSALAMR